MLELVVGTHPVVGYMQCYAPGWSPLGPTALAPPSHCSVHSTGAPGVKDKSGAKEREPCCVCLQLDSDHKCRCPS